MKKLHRLMLISFLGPFAASFAVALFILVLQFLAKYQNDIFGKGLGFWVIAQLFGYTSVQLSVMALPIAVLMSSLMTLGKLGENYELAALKATGVSLFRIMQPLIIATLFITFFNFLLTSFAVPKANLKLYSLLYDVQQAKPQLALKPGYFENSIRGFTIYFSKKSSTGKLYGVKIWDHTTYPGDLFLFAADSADMSLDLRTLYLKLMLYNGARYEERQYDQNNEDKKYPYSRLNFDTLIYKLDMSGFGLRKTDENLFGSHQYMLQIPRLYTYLDSLRDGPAETIKNMRAYIKPFLEPGELKASPLIDSLNFSGSAIELFPKDQRPNVALRAVNNARNMRNNIEFSKSLNENKQVEIRKYESEFFMKITLPLACLVFLFIGAPLGAIIRKGGLGAPTLAALIFFIAYWVLMTQGKKLAREDVVEVWFGIFFPIILMFPIAVFVTFQAATDSRLFDLSSWRMAFEQFTRKSKS